MYAIVEIQGKQYKVWRSSIINVDRLGKQPNERLNLDKVLLCSNTKESLIGQPYLTNVKIEAEVMGETKGKKVIAFKYKRRKGYHRKVGHRQKYTTLKILNIESPIVPLQQIAEKEVKKQEEKKPQEAKEKTIKLDKTKKQIHTKQKIEKKATKKSAKKPVKKPAKK